MEPIERYRGAMIGLAAGDALGTSLEFKPPGTFAPIEEMVGGGPFDLAAGQWTDDTSMSLCLAASLVFCQGFNPVDQMERYVAWYRDGYLSSTGECFDIGNTIREALSKHEKTGNPYCGPTGSRSAGNGSIMRLAPVPLFYANNPDEAIEKSALSSRTTHGAPEAIDACRYLCSLIVGALIGATKEELLSELYCPIEGYWAKRPLVKKIEKIGRGSFNREPPQIRGSGYVVESLEAALWAFRKSSSFAEGCLLAANLGDDADTTAAVYGQLAGAFYGALEIPATWRSKLYRADLMDSFAKQLLDHAAKSQITRHRVAKKNSHFKFEEMPEEQIELKCDLSFSTAEMDDICLGLIPQDMDDRWLIYLEADWLCFHRSWTGFMIYRAHIVHKRVGASIDRIIVNNDRAQFNQELAEDSVNEVITMIAQLIPRRGWAPPPPNRVRRRPL